MVNIIQPLVFGPDDPQFEIKSKINEMLNLVNRLNNPPQWGTPDWETLCDCSSPKQVNDNGEFTPNYCYRCSRNILNT